MACEDGRHFKDVVSRFLKQPGASFQFLCPSDALRPDSQPWVEDTSALAARRVLCLDSSFNPPTLAVCVCVCVCMHVCTCAYVRVFVHFYVRVRVLLCSLFV